MAMAQRYRIDTTGGSFIGKARICAAALAAMALTAPLPANASAEMPMEDKVAYELRGSFKVEQRASANDTPATLQIHQAEGRYIGETSTFGDGLEWRDGKACTSWYLSALEEPKPADPAVEAYLEGTHPLGWFSLECGGEAIDHIFVVSPDRILSRTPSGAS
jgi:hypothetical protein